VKLRVLYFAALRERVGCSEEMVEAPDSVATVAQLRSWLIQRGDTWADAFAGKRRVRAAVDQTMVDDQHVLRDGAEVAFFPPVTGG